MNKSPQKTTSLGGRYQRYSFGLAFVLIGLSVVGVGAFVVRDLIRANDEDQRMYKGLVHGLNLIGELQYQTQEARRSMLYALTTADTNEQIAYADKSKAADEKVAEMISEHMEHAATSQEKSIGSRFERDWLGYTKVRDDVVVSILEGDIKAALSRDRIEGAPSFELIRDDLAALKRVFEDRAEQQRAQVQRSFNLSLVKLIAVLVLTFFLAAAAVRSVQKNKMLGAVKQSEARLRDVIESINEGMFVIGPEWTIELWNRAAERISRLARQKVLSRQLLDALPGLASSELPAQITESLTSNATSPLIEVNLPVNGRERVFEMRVFPFHGGATVFFNDVTDRKRAEAALRESEERYRDLVQELDAIVWEADPGTMQFRFVSHRAETILGYATELWCRKPGFLDGLIHPDDRELARAHFCGPGEGCDSELEYRVVAADGRTVWLRDIRRVVRDFEGNLRMRGLMVDVSEHKKMTEELLRAQKLESIGILAGGIAHDFNNILTAVLGNISLARMLTGVGDKIFARLAAAERATLRAKDLTQQLLTFSKGGVPVKRAASVADLIADSASLVMTGSSVLCEYSLPDDLWPAEVDEGQFCRVIQNLVINAQQAMPNGGRLRVTGANVTLGPDRAVPLPSGSYVRISIEDQGVGIPGEHLHKVFDPYFTTKQKGNGLGLATAYSIIKKHDGHIAVDSIVGKGTAFVIYLPASPHARLNRGEVVESPSLGKLRVLVMDDEETIRDVAVQMLEGLGCEAVAAKDGADAIEVYRAAWQSGTPFDAVILDLTVPGGMGGKEVVEQLLKIDPKVKAIVCSGYSNDPVMADFDQHGFSGFVAKPYKIQELSDVLRRVVKRGKVGSAA
jgi:PAS domain S-box-containing protein